MRPEPQHEAAAGAATASANPLAHWEVLARAIAGRQLNVAAAAGATGWTDGTTIFIDASAESDAQLRQICVQSALIAAGSFECDIMRRLARRPKLAPRYLAIETQRALRCFAELLPPRVQTLRDAAVPHSDSPARSLQLAESKTVIAEAPAVLGEIRARAWLTAQRAASASKAEGQHVPRPDKQRPQAELPDDTDTAAENEEDFVTSPVGGGGPLGRWLQKLLKMTRRIKDGGPPGADAPTHWARSGSGARVRALPSSARAEVLDLAEQAERGWRYPEWDMHRRHYRPDWCTVHELEPPIDQAAEVEWPSGHGLRKPLARLGMGLDRCRRRTQGDDIDIDAAIDAQIELLSGRTPHEHTYIESLRQRRDLSVLILLDISGSVMQSDASGAQVHARQRRAAAELATVLYEIGDRVALYAYHSQGRSAVHLLPVKRFEERLDSLVMRRLHSLMPGAYSRLGAAIRHASTRLIEEGGTSRRLLLVLSDGLAYDHGYEPGYGAADAKRALAEARRDGVACLCLSIGASTDAESLRRVFGSAAHASVSDSSDLGALVGTLFRSALRNSEVRRHAA